MQERTFALYEVVGKKQLVLSPEHAVDDVGIAVTWRPDGVFVRNVCAAEVRGEGLTLAPATATLLTEGSSIRVGSRQFLVR